MVDDQPEIFTGRLEAIELFRRFRQRDSAKPWPLLPILSFIGPVGSGKSELIAHLRTYYCSDPALPNTRLDFTRSDIPKDLLEILGVIRDKLHSKKDPDGRQLTFPRFDILFTRLKNHTAQLLPTDELDQILSDIGGAVGNIFPPLAFGFLLLRWLLKLLALIPPLRSLIRRLVQLLRRRLSNRPEWAWYREQSPSLSLRPMAAIEAIIERLNEMCTPGEAEREFLIERILPEALLADLCYALDGPRPPRAWSKEVCVVIFFDGFEALLQASEETARRLLEVLALSKHRKHGGTDPLFLIVSGQRELPGILQEQQQAFFVTEPALDAASAQQTALNLYEKWCQQLPPPNERQRLQLKDLYLPLSLRDFNLDETRSYLLRIGREHETTLFTHNALILAIYRETYGYPAFLTRVAEVLITMKVPDIQKLFASEAGEQIVDGLLASLCSPTEEPELIFCAVPRSLDLDVLRLVLKLRTGTDRTETELSEIWRHYRRLTFAHVSSDKKKVTFHASVRSLLLKKLPVPTGGNMDSDYLRIHHRLRQYFDEQMQLAQAQGLKPSLATRVEWSYHTLALGNPQPVIEQAIYAYKHDFVLWQALLAVTDQSPTQCIPPTLTERANQALERAQTHSNSAAAIEAIILFTWLLVEPGSNSKHVGQLYLQLAEAYRNLSKDTQHIDIDKYQHAIIIATNNTLQMANTILSPPHDTQPLAPIIPESPLPSIRQTRSIIRPFFRVIRRNRRAMGLLTSSAVIALVLAFIISNYFLPLLFPAPRQKLSPNPFTLLALHAPTQNTGWIGAFVESGPNKEYIGLSDGSIPFDYLRPDGAQKILAAQKLQSGDYSSAINLLQSATRSDTNDAEALIALENARIRQAGQHCSIFIVATTIIEDTGDGVNIGRDNMQGAYVAQKENNDANPTKICLDVANLGDDPSYAPQVAQLIVHAAASNKDIQGVMGWPTISGNPATAEAIHMLGDAHIPIVSSASYDNLQLASNVFYIAPSLQRQGESAALYAKNQLHQSRAALFLDPFNSYSHGLAQGFQTRFEQDGNTLVAVESYSVGLTDQTAFATLLQQALQAHPTFIYFAGNADDGRLLLAQLTQDAPDLHILGGDALYPFVGYSRNARPGFNELVFTSVAYPDTPTAIGMQKLYAQDFDPADPQHIHLYGYSRPDGDAILSYDAQQVLLNGLYTGGGSSLQQILPGVNVVGASRAHIAFNSLHELRDQQVVVLYIDANEQLQFVEEP